MSLAHLSINFLGFLEIFRLCLYHRRLFLKYLVLNFVAIFLEETLRERDPSQERIPSQAGGEDEHRGPAGPITFLRSRKLCVLHASRMIDVRTLTLQFKVSLCTLFLRLRLARLFQSDSEQYGSNYQSVFTRLYF